MSFEDRFRAALQRADQELPAGPAVDWEKTMKKAQRGRYVNMLAVGFAAAAVIALGAISADALLGRGEESPTGPTESSSPAPSESPTQSPSPAESPLGEEPNTSCSAAGMSAELSDQDLPPAVADMRARIVQAAVACDYDALAELALAGDEFFSYSFGDDGDPGGYWLRLEEDPDNDEEPMATLVKLLKLSHCVDDFVSADVTLYSWPSASCTQPTDEDWDELIESGISTEEEVEGFKEFGSYIGWRVGIAEEGDWLSYIAGD
ncbi:MAG: hypothetical protein ACRDKB_13850 [Actinomycetota bacterium]